MSSFQLIGCMIDLDGNRDSVVVRSKFDPFPTTYPEYVLLQYIHHGVEHVHDAMVVGEVERSDMDEVQRLVEKYGAEVVSEVFPGAGQTMPLPRGSDALPTEEEVEAGQKAARVARQAVRQKRKPSAGLSAGNVNRVPELPA